MTEKMTPSEAVIELIQIAEGYPKENECDADKSLAFSIEGDVLKIILSQRTQALEQYCAQIEKNNIARLRNAVIAAALDWQSIWETHGKHEAEPAQGYLYDRVRYLKKVMIETPQPDEDATND
jgi:hypothetical protein